MKHGLKIGKDITIQELQKEYDAILIAIGASADKKLRLDHEDADGVLSAVEFLRSAGLGELPDLTGKQVVVVGGRQRVHGCGADGKTHGRGEGQHPVPQTASRYDGPAGGESREPWPKGSSFLTLKAPSSIDVDENGRVRGSGPRPRWSAP